ncbi:WS/DGAT domain-containing protein [Pseudonocardia sp. RS11V-5]|uniref:wax ester/triacylglycerol synthase domain-containing protein n=1 Tax=Pseudonocardia terrae TaxID=2905831 RepID=UPI001E2CA1B5|nr:wax ester/triacylglycerol synthase domain-containing protein [Pseudonocardia terrae]MCE3555148.1 WS/DGAT domain-containing protein [Pseudonocardia terrae]
MLARLRLDELMYTWFGGDTPMQIGLLGALEVGPFRRVDRTIDLERIRGELAVRAGRVASLHRRVVRTRLGEGRPFWVEDPAFAPLDHVEVTVLPAGTDLPSWAAARAARPLDPDRPLWRAEIVGGRAVEQPAVLVVVSHVLADGAAGVALAGALFDSGPEAVVQPVPVATPSPPPLPSHRQLRGERRHEAAEALRRLPRRPARRRPTGVHGLRQLHTAMAAFAGPEPITSLPRHIGPDRRLGIVREPLAPLRHCGHELGATVNDLVLAAVSEGLGALLTLRGENIPGLVLRAMVPATTGRADRQVGRMLVVGLPVGEPDPARRLTLIHDATSVGKARLREGPEDVSDLRLPLPVARWVLCWARRAGSRRVTLAVTDVTGPSAPLWLTGSRLLSATPIAPLSPGVALSVAALSYAGELVVSVNADAAVTDLEVMTGGMERGFAALRDLAGLASDPAGSSP